MTSIGARGARQTGFAWALAALLLALAAPTARAQFLPGSGGSGPLFKGAKPKSNGVKAPPTALPGARAGQALAPAPVSPSAMDPNTALFDAINRDDLAAARDALNRGAELGARNALGMTPLQLSIDLGRNDITFALLAMRDADRGPSGPPPAGPAGKAGPVAAASRRTAPRSLPAARRPHPVPAAPVRVAGEGGTPVPSAGFLGFDPRP